MPPLGAPRLRRLPLRQPRNRSRRNLSCRLLSRHWRFRARLPSTAGKRWGRLCRSILKHCIGLLPSLPAMPKLWLQPSWSVTRRLKLPPKWTRGPVLYRPPERKRHEANHSPDFLRHGHCRCRGYLAVDDDFGVQTGPISGILLHTGLCGILYCGELWPAPNLQGLLSGPGRYHWPHFHGRFSRVWTLFFAVGADKGELWQDGYLHGSFSGNKVFLVSYGR